YLAVQIATMEADHSIDVLYCDAEFFGDGPDVGVRFMQLNPSQGEVNAEALIRQHCNVMVAAVVRRDVFSRVGLFDESLKGTEDFDLWLRIAKSGGHIGYHRRVLVLSRRRAGSLSADIELMTEGHLRVLAKAEAELALTPEERRAVADQRKRIVAERCLIRGKHAIAAGDFTFAIEQLRQANRFFTSRRIARMLLGLRVAPRLLRLIYDMQSRFAAQRARRRVRRGLLASDPSGPSLV